jgi:hypothetical protein
MFGHVKAEIIDDMMVVSGIKTKWFLKEMEKVTGTVRFSTTVLKNIRSFSFSVPKFFVYDFYHLVKVMYENPYRYIAPVLLESLLEQMKQTEWIQRSLTKQRSRLDYGRLKDFAFEPLPKQREFLEVYDQTTQKYGMKGFMLDSAPGSGKALPLGARLKTPTGWIFMRNVKVGDTLVSADGKPTKVTGVYPQGVLKKYRITFADGRAADCSGDHLWNVHFKNFKQPWRTVTTSHL